MNISLTDRERSLVLVNNDDWIAVLPGVLTKGEIIPNIGLNKDNAHVFHFRSLETDWRTEFHLLRRKSEPHGLEQIGQKVLVCFYNCPSVNSCWPIGVVGMQNSQDPMWVDNQYQCYAQIQRLKKPAALRLAAQAFAPRLPVLATTEQKHVIRDLITGIERRRSEFAHYFAEAGLQTNDVL